MTSEEARARERRIDGRQYDACVGRVTEAVRAPLLVRRRRIASNPHRIASLPLSTPRYSYLVPRDSASVYRPSDRECHRPRLLYCCYIARFTNTSFTNATNEFLGKLIDFALIIDAGIGDDFSFVMHALVHVSVQEFICTRETMQAAMENTGETLRKVLPNGEHENWGVGQPVYRL